MADLTLLKHLFVPEKGHQYLIIRHLGCLRRRRGGFKAKTAETLCLSFSHRENSKENYFKNV